MVSRITGERAYFARSGLVHLLAIAGLALMYLLDMTVLGGASMLAMMGIVLAATFLLHGFAWLRVEQLSFSARSMLVVLSLLGPLYTLLILALYAFAVSTNPLIQALPLILVGLCLICMWLAVRRT